MVVETLSVRDVSGGVGELIRGTGTMENKIDGGKTEIVRVTTASPC